jgi:hypothetical protein
MLTQIANKPVGATNYNLEVNTHMKTMMKKHIKTLLAIGALATPVLALAATPPPAKPGAGAQPGGLSIGSIVRAVEQGVGNVIVYPMEQFGQTIKYTFDTRAEKESIATQSRFVELAQLQSLVNQNSQDIAKQFDSINTTMASDPVSAQAAMTQNNQYCSKANGIFGKKTCISANSANNFLDNAQYQAGSQTQAAQQFLHTAAGAYLTEQAPSKDWNQGSPDVISYEAFYKTTQAIQSLAEHNLSYAYAIRQSSNGQPSELAEYNQVMTGDSSNPGFWQAINKIPVVGQLVTIANYMPALAVGIAQENKYLSMINSSLSVMLIQQNMLAEKAFGGTLYEAADSGSQADNGQNSNNGDGGGNGGGSDNSNNSPANNNSANGNGGNNPPADNNNSPASNASGGGNNSGSNPSESAAQNAKDLYSHVPKKHISRAKAMSEAAKHPGLVKKAKNAAKNIPDYGNM